MDIVQAIVLGLALSGPISVLIGMGRAVMCLDRSVRAHNTRSALLAALAIFLLFALLAVILVVWFGYGVAHTGKDARTDAIVLASTVIPSYIGVYSVWRLSGKLERAFRPNAS